MTGFKISMIVRLKYFLSKVLLDKINSCRLVVNKLDIINSTFRNFEMEILAQDDRDAQPNTNVSVCEAGIKFKFDFAKVYWNPRLSTERKRIIDLLNHKVDIVYDVFAGVGPFAVPIAKIRKCKVLANDLNPDAYHWLKENVALNKVENLVECFNLDGREFIKNQIKFDIIKQMEEFNGTNLNRRLHVLMNLPELALDFLKEFDGLLSSIENVHDKFVPDILVIHCYCFLRNISNPSEYLIDLVSSIFEYQIEPKDVMEISEVRKVSTNKLMFRFSFQLNKEILYRNRKNQSSNTSDLDDSNEKSKKLKTQ